jgi:hypothetical protein
MPVQHVARQALAGVDVMTVQHVARQALAGVDVMTVQHVARNKITVYFNFHQPVNRKLVNCLMQFVA